MLLNGRNRETLRKHRVEPLRLGNIIKRTKKLQTTLTVGASCALRPIPIIS